MTKNIYSRYPTIILCGLMVTIAASVLRFTQAISQRIENSPQAEGALTFSPSTMELKFNTRVQALGVSTPSKR
ncbi:hypothetical protein ASD38_02195 [Caulobacter sp. Root487D2Y]|jgi:hypothetical protein|uniref:hypothetical protein n=1 Tax=Caulobacter sp. Root487D2Y TaxID=1736547 RepID=UPI0006FDCACD|nr:hypothetical protein [Caulobacter sp. Root487D2Y]KQY35395.1 hypothetical protein ASD38_02195 [Caulobacter sp. Root487D2Y]